MNVLTLNAGSNSLKFEIVEAGNGERFGTSLLSGSYENIGKPGSSFTLLAGKVPRFEEPVEVRDHGHATELLWQWLKEGGAAREGAPSLDHIGRIAHRVVHGGDLFDGPAEITPQTIAQIESLQDLAPLHNASSLRVIRAAERQRAKNVPMYALFDTVFHRTIPDEAATYGLPFDLAHKHKIRRYGFHGLSHRYMMLRYAELTNRPPETLNLVTLHLEGGSSAAAIQQGRSVDTSMGFTPLEGLLMGTRCGDLDPALVTYLMRKETLDIESVEALLNKQSGLLGLSGLSADTRELEKHLDDPRAGLAMRVFCYRVRKYTGGYLAALGGAGAIIFGGGIGENTASVREAVSQGLAWCGARLDPEKNRAANDREAEISTPGSPLQLWVIPTQEGLMMAREAAQA